MSEQTKTAQKKEQKRLEAERKKEEKAAAAKQLENEKHKARLEEAKKVTIEQDGSLPEPVKTRIRDCQHLVEKRVKVYGFVHRLRQQGKNLMFLVLRDGTGHLQCVFNNQLCQTYGAVTLSTESSVCIYGILKKLPEGKSAEGGIELVADFWEVAQMALPGGIDNVLNEEDGVKEMLDNRLQQPMMPQQMGVAHKQPAISNLSRVVKRKCGVCKETGHIRNNKSCPMHPKRVSERNAAALKHLPLRLPLEVLTEVLAFFSREKLPRLENVCRVLHVIAGQFKPYRLDRSPTRRPFCPIIEALEESPSQLYRMLGGRSLAKFLFLES